MTRVLAHELRVTCRFDSTSSLSPGRHKSSVSDIILSGHFILAADSSVDVYKRRLFFVRLVHQSIRVFARVFTSGIFIQARTFLVKPDQVHPESSARTDSNGVTNHDGKEAGLVDRRLLRQEQLWPNDVAQTVGDEQLETYNQYRNVPLGR